MTRAGRAILVAAGLSIGAPACDGDPDEMDGEGASDPTGEAPDAAEGEAPAGDRHVEAGDGGCGDLGAEGACDDQVLSFCADGRVVVQDCAEDGRTCQFASAEIGFDCVPEGGGFGYPVGDGTTWPAGGWAVTQVLGHVLDDGDFHGAHLAQDVALSEEETADAPVFSIGEGEVLFAGPNASPYVNVVLIRHDVPGEGVVCSFYGHLGTVTVAAGQVVARGEPIATVLDWNATSAGPTATCTTS